MGWCSIPTDVLIALCQTQSIAQSPNPEIADQSNLACWTLRHPAEPSPTAGRVGHYEGGGLTVPFSHHGQSIAVRREALEQPQHPLGTATTAIQSNTRQTSTGNQQAYISAVFLFCFAGLPYQGMVKFPATSPTLPSFQLWRTRHALGTRATQIGIH
jgi:hypothetical protein